MPVEEPRKKALASSVERRELLIKYNKLRKLEIG